MHIIICEITSPGLMHETGLVHWDDPEGWDGEGDSGRGTHVYPWLIHVNVWQKPLQYCKVISLQFKKKKSEQQKIDAFELWCWRKLYLLGD